MIDYGSDEIGGGGLPEQTSVIQGRVYTAQAQRASPLLPTPRQLPGTPPFLVGRDRDLYALDHWAQEQHSGPLVLTGPAGVGKAALCLTWLHRCATSFPDGQLYADLRSYGHPVAPLTVLHGFLISLGLPPEAAPPDLASSAALFRSLTAGRRLAVMLHGATSAAQVRPLIPGGSSSRTLVTSTWRLPTLRSEGAQWLAVEPLSPDACVQLLSRIAGAERVAAETAAAREVAVLCGGLPLAVCLIANQLAYNAYQRLSRLAAELKDEQRRLDRLTEEGEGVRAVIDSCYRGLPPDAARMYRLLGVLPLNRFSTPVASAAASVPEADAGSLLRTLADANLIQQIGEDSYQFHELVRLHARGLTDGAHSATRGGDAREAAIIRVERWYLATACAAATRIRPYRRDRPGEIADLATPPLAFATLHAALDWLDTEAPHLLALAKNAAEQQRPRTALRIAGQMWSLFAQRKYYRTWQEFDLLGLRCARALGDQGAEARMLRRLGLLTADLGLYDEATRHLTTAADLYERLGDAHRQATAITSLGVVSLRGGSPQKAIRLLHQALTMHQRLGDTRQVALVLIDLGDALTEAGSTEEALERLTQAEEGLRNSPDLYSRAHLRMLKGRALGRLGARSDHTQTERAQAELRSALETMEALASTTGQIEAFGYLGELAERDDSGHDSGHDAGHDAASAYEQAAALLGWLGTPSSAWLRHRISGLSPLAARILSDGGPTGPP